ncbi:mitochondrial protein Pet127-domain-containing protein [Echria macrotheca]|uniref:Mitochondrial protein Pet127-domain-containing protein n=1 Tax=Echria macrotheca TaxID=438768 RepID=A0AAJ0F7J2_9PEZI|nr:mitochondrial protein Pet127-domain-containing protein [Echria macrotheca]
MKVRLFNPQSIDLTPVAVPTPPVPRLSYDLDRDPRTLVYNFDPYLAQIMPVNEFDFDALKEYVTSSKDTTLIAAARQYGQKYAGSTSSMTSMLAHFHFLLSQWRPINCAALSRDFKVESTSFNRFLRAPAATFLHYNDGVYAIDADKEFDTANVLSMLGKSMEKLLTLPKEHFMKYHKTHSDKLPDNIRNAPESYHFSTMENFLMRSQLDAYDPRLPGTGMFDLKTRAVVTVRMDAAGYQKGSDYEIRSIRGQWQSFEREYYDMIRAAFLKYSLQVRMGRMDGIFTAYHNTRRIFGFQYIPLSEMDQAIHGTSSLKLGDTEFKASMHLLRKALDQITKRFPKKSIRLHVETRPTNPPCMYIFAKPVTADEISEVQLEAQRRVKEVERQILGMKEMAGADTNTTQTPDGSEGEEASPANATPGEDPEELSDADAWEAMMDTLETSLESEEEVSTAVRDSLEDALRASGLLKSMTAEKVESYLDTLEDILTGGDTHAAGPEPAAPVPQETATSAAEETDGGDLILRAVERAKSIPSEASSPPLPAGETDPSSIQKAQKFETILLELAAQAKEQGENAPEAASTQSQTSNNDPSEGKAEQPAQTTDTKHASTKGAQKEEADPLLGLILTIRNKVNGEYVARPRGLSQTEEWEIEYAFSELPRDRARRIYDQLRRRRETSFRSDEDRSVQWYYSWQGALPKYASEGKQYRADLRGLVDTKQPVHVVGEGGGMFTWESMWKHYGLYGIL